MPSPHSFVDLSASTLAVDAGDKHTVSSDNSDESIHSDVSVDGNGELPTEPSSLEPTTSLDVEQDCAAHVLAEDPFDSDASRALFDAIDKFQSCGASSQMGTPQVSYLASRYFVRIFANLYIASLWWSVPSQSESLPCFKA